MAAIQDIENRLRQIDPGTFQELCDRLICRMPGSPRLLCRKGTQLGALKTVKGTPDTVFVGDDGKYILAEYTTDSSRNIKKLRDDIGKCLDPSKTGIALCDIGSIILACNFRVDNRDHDELYAVLKERGIGLELFTIDRIAIILSNDCRDIVHELLRLPYDSGQVVSVDTFISEYDTATRSIAAPLNVGYVCRQESLESSVALLKESDILILHGPPGVGKTRHALETIRDFCRCDSRYRALCISDKGADLLPDLYSYVPYDDHVILFADDANRIDRIKQLLGFKKSHAGLKLIMTVRSYALDEVRRHCSGYSCNELSMTTLSSGQIEQIIDNLGTGISGDRDIKSRIVSFANGNARIAVMATVLADRTGTFSASNVSSLMEQYFSTFIPLSKEKNQEKLVKTMGLLAFMHITDMKESSSIHDLTEGMGLAYEDFISSIYILEKNELIEIRYECVKVPDQNVASFFIYLAFVKTGHLSLKALLHKFGKRHMNKIHHCIISVHNSYGHEAVVSKLQPQIRSFYYSCADEDLKADLADKFWYYLQEEVMNIVSKRTCLLPAPDPDAVFEEKRPRFKNMYCYVITQISRLVHTERYPGSIRLGMEFVRRAPDKYGEFLQMLEDEMAIRKHDFEIGFVRQKELLRCIYEGVGNGDALSIALFGPVTCMMLSRRVTYMEHGEDCVNFITITIPDNSYVNAFRKQLWSGIDRFWSRVGSPDLLKKCHRASLSYPEGSLSMQDEECLAGLIGKYLDPGDFLHCRFVHQTGISSLLARFTNDRMKLYASLNPDCIRRKRRESQPLGLDIKTESQAYTVYAEMEWFYDNEPSNARWGYDDAVGAVLEEVMNMDTGLGMSLFGHIRNNNFARYSPFTLFKRYSSDRQMMDRFWKLVSQKGYRDYCWWVGAYLMNLDGGFCTAGHVSALYDITSSADSDFILQDLPMLGITDDGVFVLDRVMHNVFMSNSSGGRIVIRERVMMKYAESPSCDVWLLEGLYLQQVAIDKDYDHDQALAIRIMEKDKWMLLRLLENVDDWGSEGQKDSLHKIWAIEGIEDVMKRIMDHYVSHAEPVGPNRCNMFFGNRSEIREQKFLLDYVAANANDVDAMDLVMDIVENSRKDLLGQVLVRWLESTDDFSLFMNIRWINLSRIFYGDVNFSRMRIERWHRILSIIDALPDKYRYHEIVDYIYSEIYYLQSAAEKEDRHNYQH